MRDTIKWGEIIVLQTTLCLAAAAAVINIWLAIRIGKLRGAHKVSVGDGGIEAITRRMRAQANFIEQTPITLILFGLANAFPLLSLRLHGSAQEASIPGCVRGVVPATNSGCMAAAIARVAVRRKLRSTATTR